LFHATLPLDHRKGTLQSRIENKCARLRVRYVQNTYGYSDKTKQQAQQAKETKIKREKEINNVRR
jgi:hypothetical protein